VAGGTITTKDATAPTGLERKATSTSPESGLLEADDATGVVEAIVSVTGIRDDVDDIIEPGAYAKTLANRRPKGIFVHDWNRWAARTEEIAELPPGDARLPKQTKDGKPWPAEAGGLYVKTRFNLKTDEGRNAYENVKFFSETGECDWSIGYKVPRGAATRGQDGARHIKEIDLYEYSPVLFGAAGSFSGTLSVKSADAAIDALEDDDTDSSEAEPEGDGAEGPDATPPADEPAPEDAPAEATPPIDEPAPDDVEPEAAEGPDWAALDAAADGLLDDAPADAEDEAKMAHEPLNRSPKKNWVEMAGELPAYIQHIAKDLAEKQGMPMERAIPTAIAAVKRWAAGGGDVKPDTRAKAAAAVAEWEKLKAKSHARTAAHRAADAAKSAEPADGDGGVYPFLPGTYEELRDALLEQATKSLTGGEDEPAYLVDIIGTWPDRIVAARFPLDGKSAAETFEVTYELDDDGGTVLGDPIPVNLVVEGDDGAAEPAESLLPFPSLLDDVTAGIKSHLFADADVESKVGRVLSGVNAIRLKSAVENLVAVLEAAGVHINTPDEQDEDDDAQAAVEQDSTAPSARSGAYTVPSGKVLISPDLAARAYRLLGDVHAGT
jgi:phage head maturation protease